MNIPKRMVLVPTMLALFALIAVGYWYVYGRQRELIEPVKWSDIERGSPSKADFEAMFAPAPLQGRLALTPSGDSGSVLSGLIISEKKDWIINRVRVSVRITETRHCGEKLQSMLSDPEWDKHCAENQNHTVRRHCG